MNETSDKYQHEARSLNQQEVETLERDTKLVSEFKQNKLEIEAKKNWDLFYKRNETRFFKDRHWTNREFELDINLEDEEDSEVRPCLLEVGCGVGNFIFPLIEEGYKPFVYACDFSPRAIELVKVIYDGSTYLSLVNMVQAMIIMHTKHDNHSVVQSNPLYDTQKCQAFVCDISQEDSLSQHIQPGTIALATLVFVLSALHPDKMAVALRNIHRVLRPRGRVCFRDYGLYDQAMLRFKPGHKLSENFYVRQDGTRAYYFPK
ncbi:METTL6, partial [Cordylochernes scorpioides]